MNGKDRVLKALNNKQPDRVPVLETDIAPINIIRLARLLSEEPIDISDDEAKVEDIKKIEQDLFEYIEIQNPEIFKKIRETGDLDENTEKELEKIIREVLKNYVSKRN